MTILPPITCMRHLQVATAYSILLAAPVMAQVDPKIHKLCIEAKDYAGCVKAMTGNSNGESTSPATSLYYNYIEYEKNQKSFWTAENCSKYPDVGKENCSLPARAFSPSNASPPSASTANERPTDGASVATWQGYCNSQGKTYYERTSGLSWFGIKLSNKKEWQGCLTDAEAAQSGAGTTTYQNPMPRLPVNCHGSGYSTGSSSYNTKTTCY